MNNFNVELYKDMINSPHTLVGGTTGSGKSNVMNGIIRQIMTDYTPAQAEMYFIDPKVVELQDYKDTAFCKGFITEMEDVPMFLDNIIEIMESRYRSMAAEHKKEYTGIRTYLIIDELADILTCKQKKIIKEKLQKILRKARASHIHCIMATQSPSRGTLSADVVLNITNRLALRCAEAIESRQLINQTGAEELHGVGTGIYKSPNLEGLKKVSIPLTPDNADIIAKYERKPEVKPQAKEEVEEERTVYIAAPKDYSEPRTFDPNRTADIIRNIGLAIGGIGFVLAMLA